VGGGALADGGRGGAGPRDGEGGLEWEWDWGVGVCVLGGEGRLIDWLCADVSWRHGGVRDKAMDMFVGFVFVSWGRGAVYPLMQNPKR
jgi:hypothetical protein